MIQSKLRGDLGDIMRGSGNRAPGLRGRTSISGAVVADQADPTRLSVPYP
jgi:hypothetical protein